MLLASRSSCAYLGEWTTKDVPTSFRHFRSLKSVPTSVRLIPTFEPQWPQQSDAVCNLQNKTEKMQFSYQLHCFFFLFHCSFQVNIFKTDWTWSFLMSQMTIYVCNAQITSSCTPSFRTFFYFQFLSTFDGMHYSKAISDFDNKLI